MTIVVAYAPGRYGRVAVDVGVALARRDGTDVVVVNGTRGDAYIDRRYAQREELEEIRGVLEGSEVPFTLRQTMGADIADQVIGVLNEVAGALLVVGLRPRSPVGKMLLGSVAQQLLGDSPVPVLAVKPGQVLSS